jgi:hypothetical protein
MVFADEIKVFELAVNVLFFSVLAIAIAEIMACPEAI